MLVLVEVESLKVLGLLLKVVVGGVGDLDMFDGKLIL